jgi:UDP-N-acetylmuramate dehydrogenase
VQQPTARQIFDWVCAIRSAKLPDPRVIGNAGSFFKNPIVPAAQADALALAHPGLPVWPHAGGTAKISAGWLIEAAGFKGGRDGDAGMSNRHALVLVNHGKATGPQLWAIAQKVIAGVQARFGVVLEPEPLIV